jgi:hypothetical protein
VVDMPNMFFDEDEEKKVVDTTNITTGIIKQNLKSRKW